MPQRDIHPEYSYEHFPVAASANLLEGSVITKASGTPGVRNWVRTDVFIGLALRAADNSAGVLGSLQVPCLVQGIIKNLAVNDSNASTQPGTPVYSTGVNSFTLLATGGLLVGDVHKGVSEDVCDVYILGEGRRVA